MIAEITEADREAAAGCIPFLTPWFREDLISGQHDDNDAIQAFARYRLASREQALRWAADIAYATCAETRHVSLGDKVRRAILSELAAAQND